MKNPYAIFNKEISVEEVMNSPTIFPPYLKRLEACPPSCGAAAAIVCSEAFARKHAITRGINILAQVMTTDRTERDLRSHQSGWRWHDPQCGQAAL